MKIPRYRTDPLISELHWLAIGAIGDLGALCAPNVPGSPLVKTLRMIHAQRLRELERVEAMFVKEESS